MNGKVERSHRVDDQEFYQLLDKDGISDDIHLFNEKLREWENYYDSAALEALQFDGGCADGQALRLRHTTLSARRRSSRESFRKGPG